MKICESPVQKVTSVVYFLLIFFKTFLQERKFLSYPICLFNPVYPIYGAEISKKSFSIRFGAATIYF